MTRIVKEYIKEKIKEGAQARLDELNARVDEAEKRKITHDDIEELVKDLPEFKALKKAVVKSMKDKFGAEVTKVGVPRTYYWIEWNIPRIRKARDEREKFLLSLDRVIRDALVELELSKSKADVDEVIAKAVAAISKAK